MSEISEPALVGGPIPESKIPSPLQGEKETTRTFFHWFRGGHVRRSTRGYSPTPHWGVRLEQGSNAVRRSVEWGPPYEIAPAERTRPGRDVFLAVVPTHLLHSDARLGTPFDRLLLPSFVSAFRGLIVVQVSDFGAAAVEEALGCVG